ncbi:putative plasma membrane low affinity zinc ion transporter [Xylona heveae TC161]|uniref:Putative plasma membrane low affinity zinc ion transporter n=1 Tax=Xylona heveae (strain CBS 132557 / TC161) TaxID=1328760 RepID=A0A165I1E6_XYLHT|nr:putative plasma membrane low affinity zinc ion transporter [Xylona heveae TC161]KZF24220.1 putative plasma membrane low affinity zinc ion transporter [Xylona heveae TC161]
MADYTQQLLHAATFESSTNALGLINVNGGYHPPCRTGNDYDGRMGIRISSIFVILIGSLFGAAFPVFASRHRSVGLPEWSFFFAKYFGSGVILATAFVHLLAPARHALTNPCLTGPITEYEWVEGICLMTIFALFVVELLAMRYATFADDETEIERQKHQEQYARLRTGETGSSHAPGEDHLGHSREHIDPEGSADGSDVDDMDDNCPAVSFAAQMTAIFILEFGVVFHSIFVGLTLAVTGSNFNTLYLVLVFHQTFEGLGLGSRLASVPWPRSKRWTPYLLALGFGVTTPIAIGVGLAIRESYPPGSASMLIINGVFDSISAGILIYTALVELMAHEFMFSESMRKARMEVVLCAVGLMALGAGIMALLGKWG